MSRKLLTLSLTATLMGGTAFADAPRVAVDIAPVHSLVTRVMEGVGTPDLIIQAGASPHEYSLRPSEAAALQDANLVFWIGSGLTPWLTDTIETLAPNANVTELLEADGTIELEFREGALFEAHDDHEEDEHRDDDDHKEEDDDHANEEAGHDEHEHGDHDPHAWLSPQNAMTWMNVIAGQLSAADPDNAGAYFANAAAGRAEIKVLIGEVTATLDPVRDGRFIVFHDAYQYFETDFNFPASGAISISDASDPSPARIAEIQDRIAEQGIDCVLAEPQFNPGLVATVLEGSNAQTGILDPLGSDLKPGSALYPQLIRNLSTALAGCM
ncbi:zinc ABC transporter substrate-binding protein [Ascidiaceihabitans sp.]|nr:zinc ABC transporter substrate-binding protein [Ascidiaceihabitans sp.]